MIGQKITILLNKWNDGDKEAFDQIIHLVYDELHRLAHKKLGREFYRGDLQTTDLLHEVIYSLEVGQSNFKNTRHFYHTAGLAMHRFLIDLARKRQTCRHGGGLTKLPFRDEHGFLSLDSETVLMINDLLDELEQKDPIMVQVVKLRYFAGYTIKETAEILDEIPIVQVNRKWEFAKVWLKKRIDQQ